MITVISPSKTQDFSPCSLTSGSEIRSPKETLELVEIIKKLSIEGLMDLMNVSRNIANINHFRFKYFKKLFSIGDSKQAIFAFKGDVYTGIKTKEYLKDDLDFLQDNVRILSGLYGSLRPLDLIQPYRLEMGLRLKNENGNNIYRFWGDKISKSLNTDESEILINLASNEYFKGIDQKSLDAKIIHVHFKEFKKDKYKVVAIHAKRARGQLVNHIVKNRIQTPEGLLSATPNGYIYNSSLSDESNLVFTKG
jgi:cytoplasmic iron level regulating protein YaaA (DUF328/UPF0246 family)